MVHSSCYSSDAAQSRAMLGSLLMCGLALAEGIQAEQVDKVTQMPESIQWVKRILFHFDSTAFNVQRIDDHGRLKQVHQVEQAQRVEPVEVVQPLEQLKQMEQIEPTDKVTQVTYSG